jgi:hypothetical protein
MYELYELYCLSPEVLETYVGHCRNLRASIWYHETCCEFSMFPLYKFIREHGGWSNWSYRILFTCDTSDEIKALKVPGALNSCDWSCFDDFHPTIYKIFCLDPMVTEVYVGKTTCFCARLLDHCFTCERNDSKKVYKFIREHGGWYKWKMEIVGVYPFATSFDLDRLEFIWWKRLGGQLNTRVPGFKKFLYLGDDEEFCQCVLSNGCRKPFTKDEIFLDI